MCLPIRSVIIPVNAALSSDFEYHSYDYTPYWTTLNPITITNCAMHLVPYTVTYTEPADVKVRWETCAPAQSSH